MGAKAQLMNLASARAEAAGLLLAELREAGCDQEQAHAIVSSLRAASEDHLKAELHGCSDVTRSWHKGRCHGIRETVRQIGVEESTIDLFETRLWEEIKGQA